MSERIGDGPIDPALRDQMNALARAIDEIFNGPRSPGQQKSVGFILLAFPFDGHEGRCNYISNAQREDVVVLLKEQLARLSGQPELRGRA